MSLNNLSKSASDAILIDSEYEDDLINKLELGKTRYILTFPLQMCHKRNQKSQQLQIS